MKHFIKDNENTLLVIKILLVALLVAALIYFLYPLNGHSTVVINGTPVVDPVAQFMTLPVLLAAGVFTGILFTLAFLGAGLFVFLAAFLFMLFGVFVVAPYVWPLLLLILIIVLMMFFGKKSSAKP